MATVLLVRHGRSTANTAGVLAGRTPGVQLDEVGLRQATDTAVRIGVLPVAFYSLLPVLRNTIVGIRNVDPALIDAARGQGMSSGRVLRTVELPLAVPFILAGLRTTLVLAVGTATLSFLVDAGGLGIFIDTGYRLQDYTTLVVGSVLAVKKTWPPCTSTPGEKPRSVTSGLDVPVRGSTRTTLPAKASAT